uniref:Bm13551 n=1 Tax=Brugia malayi TaxID=6279 RepID=A0A1I9G4W9_BRUMA|nr:Bm13551 [Brugia malayi]
MTSYVRERIIQLLFICKFVKSVHLCYLYSAVTLDGILSTDVFDKKLIKINLLKPFHTSTLKNITLTVTVLLSTTHRTISVENNSSTGFYALCVGPINELLLVSDGLEDFMKFH